MNKPGERAIDKLLVVMKRLRDPNTGCPWDVEQTYASIAPSTIEEAYEVVDAIEKEDFDHLREELGDLLFQVVFYAQLGSEYGRFNFNDIASVLTDKLIRRHPHVFPGGQLEGSAQISKMSEGEVKAQWELIKQEERKDKGQEGVLQDIPASLPAVARAAKLQKRASSIGFDWPDYQGALDKVREELDELQQAIDSQDESAINEELGDTLFSLVNVSRHLKVDPERALRNTNRKFTDRFNFIEAQLRLDGLSPEQASLEQMDLLWEQAKTCK